MRKPASLLAVTLGSAALVLQSVSGAYAATLPELNLLPGRVQAIQFGAEVKAVQAPSSDIVRMQIKGNRLILRGLKPGSTDLELVLTGSNMPLTMSIQVAEGRDEESDSVESSSLTSSDLGPDRDSLQLRQDAAQAAQVVVEDRAQPAELTKLQQEVVDERVDEHSSKRADAHSNPAQDSLQTLPEAVALGSSVVEERAIDARPVEQDKAQTVVEEHSDTQSSPAQDSSRTLPEAVAVVPVVVPDKASKRLPVEQNKAPTVVRSVETQPGQVQKELQTQQEAVSVEREGGSGTEVEKAPVKKSKDRVFTVLSAEPRAAESAAEVEFQPEPLPVKPTPVQKSVEAPSLSGASAPSQVVDMLPGLQLKREETRHNTEFPDITFDSIGYNPDAEPADSTDYDLILKDMLSVSPSELSLFDAVNRALTLNPEVQAEELEVERALGEIKVAEWGYWPSLELSVGPENIGESEIGYDVLLTQMLFDWGRVSSEVAAATAKQRQQVQSLLLVRNDAALELVEIAYDLQSARQQMKVLDFFTDKLEALHALTRQRTAGRYSDKAELSRIRQALGYMQEQRSNLQSEIHEAENQYSILMNMPPKIFPRLDEPVDLLDRLVDERTLDQVISRSPTFLDASHELMLAQAQVDQAEAQYKPRVMLEASAQKYEDSDGDITEDSSIALRLRMDAMQGLSAFQRAEMERQNLEAAQWRLDSAKRKLKRQFRSLQASKIAQEQRQQALAQQLSQVGTIRETYREQFVAGLRNIDDLISVEREGYELAIQQIQSTNERQRLIYRAAADLGLLLPLLSGELEGSLAP